MIRAITEAVCCFDAAVGKSQVTRVLSDLDMRGFEVASVGLETGVRRMTGPPVVIYITDARAGSVAYNVRQLKTRFPTLPILIYAPKRVAAEMVALAKELPLVEFELQHGPAADQTSILAGLMRLFAKAPVERALRIMRSALGGATPESERVLRAAVRCFRPAARRAPTVADLGAQLGASRRSVERHWYGADLPTPKQMMDWATLLVVAATAWACDTTPIIAARGIHVDAQRLYRLRRRFGVEATEPSDPRAMWSAVNSAFRDWCDLRRRRFRAGMRALPPSRTGPHAA